MRGNTLFIPQTSGLHRLHPFTKLTGTLFLLVCAAVLPDLIWILTVFLVFECALAWWGKILGAFLRSCLGLVTPFVISLLVIQGFFTGGETALFSVWRFAFTTEGALAGLTVAGRILLALGGTLLMMQSTRPDVLMLSLTQRGLPSSLAFIVLSAVQLFPRFQEQTQIILDAQQSRGLETRVGFFRRAGLLVPLMGPLVLGSVVDVEERAMALEARGFSRVGTKSSYLVLKDTVLQRLARIGLFLSAGALIAWRIWQGFS